MRKERKIILKLCKLKKGKEKTNEKNKGKEMRKEGRK